MTESVCTALGIDKVDMRGRLVLIDEQHGSDANFIINSVLSRAVENGHGICLVLFHNTFGHYHNVGMKLGYNLTVLRDRGQVNVVEPMKIIAQNVEDLGHDAVDADGMEIGGALRPGDEDNFKDFNVTKLDANLVRQLFLPVRNSCREALKSQESVVVIIDDLSHLFDIGLSLRDVWYYTRYLRSLMEYEPTLSVYIMTHTYRAHTDSCQPDMIAVGLKHMAHLIVTVEPLVTGHANDINGKLSVNWKIDNIRRENNWAEKSTYLYKLSDRQVKIFVPGSSVPLA